MEHIKNPCLAVFFKKIATEKNPKPKKHDKNFLIQLRSHITFFYQLDFFYENSTMSWPVFISFCLIVKRDKSKTAIIQYYNMVKSHFFCNRHFYPLLNSYLSLLVHYLSFSISLSLSLYFSLYLSLSFFQSFSLSYLFISSLSLLLFLSSSFSVLFSHYLFFTLFLVSCFLSHYFCLFLY